MTEQKQNSRGCDNGEHLLRFNTPVLCPECGRDIREEIKHKIIVEHGSDNQKMQKINLPEMKK